MAVVRAVDDRHTIRTTTAVHIVRRTSNNHSLIKI